MGDGKGSQNPGFGDRVRTLRAAAGLTQAELAQQASVSERTNTSRARGGGKRFFFTLCATGDPDMVLPLIVKTVGLTPEAGEMQLAVSRRLGDGPTLVLPARFERLVAAEPAVGSLIEACP